MRITEIHPAIQGEGCLAGMPMILVRFAGCSAGCPWCDTKHSWSEGDRLSVRDAADFVRANTTGQKWVLITGGEPMEQADEVYALMRELRPDGYRFALETNGAHPIEEHEFDWICVSPKPQLKLTKSAIDLADEVKYVVGAGEDIPSDLLGSEEGDRPRVILLQPMSQDPEATELCIKTVEERGWRLSVQIHKYLSLP